MSCWNAFFISPGPCWAEEQVARVRLQPLGGSQLLCPHAPQILMEKVIAGDWTPFGSQWLIWGAKPRSHTDSAHSGDHPIRGRVVLWTVSESGVLHKEASVQQWWGHDFGWDHGGDPGGESVLTSCCCLFFHRPEVLVNLCINTVG